MPTRNSLLSGSNSRDVRLFFTKSGLTRYTLNEDWGGGGHKMKIKTHSQPCPTLYLSIVNCVNSQLATAHCNNFVAVDLRVDYAFVVT